MALIVEDGTGLSTAEGYVSVDYVKTYHKVRANALSNATGDIEAHIRLATEYMDLRWGSGAPGNKISDNQALSWPTDYFEDPLPIQLLRACAEYTSFSLNNSLFLDNTNAEAGIIELTENVGPLQTTTVYSGGGSGANGPKYPKVPKADNLMRLIAVVSGYGGVIR